MGKGGLEHDARTPTSIKLVSSAFGEGGANELLTESARVQLVRSTAPVKKKNCVGFVFASRL